jgi:aspartyl-tRNA(Asn)/glutamyl-tRNA(Gln) amidotransferase subunit C
VPAKGRIIPHPLQFALGRRLCHPWLYRDICAISTMSLDSTDIARIANLARLELQPEESTRMLGQINAFFDIVTQISQVDTTGVLPMAHPVDAMQHLQAQIADADADGITLRLRPDVASEPDAREANQRSAPAVERGLFLVPKVIE